MSKQILVDTIKQLFAGNKGLLAIDESNATCNKRFAVLGIPQTLEMRRKYRELLITTPGLNASVGGIILYDETIHQQTGKGIPFTDLLQDEGIIIGIKVDTGTKPLAGFHDEKITEGLDGLRDRLTAYKKLGVKFAKWRAVFSIGEARPSLGCIKANANALARYAALCQESGIVPVVEPEIVMAGKHSIERCYEVTEQVLKLLFQVLYDYKVDLEGMILKPNMVISGNDSAVQNTVEEVARATTQCLLSSVPASVPAIAFLSGGQSPEQASAHLKAIHTLFKNRLPWTVTFSFGRAIQQPALRVWQGQQANDTAAQVLLYRQASLDPTALQGAHDSKNQYALIQ
ncbi:hypothetical protein LCGC14_0837780 [marine sediment metagenome]|uniref:Fructose-bisphosphate aldolase n=2 Tax=root TaxID=1 RepID=A0A831QSQ8_9FLAO|nr:fructose-bisphosphate aldolase class I [Pricia sp.]HEA22026.1 fructose-bisphosphate aldolase class I [Pricia antarctica]